MSGNRRTSVWRKLHITDLNLLNGDYVNLEYSLPNDRKIKFLKDNRVYFGNQVEKPKSDRCYGIVADEKFLLVCEYGRNGDEPDSPDVIRYEGKTYVKTPEGYVGPDGEVLGVKRVPKSPKTEELSKMTLWLFMILVSPTGITTIISGRFYKRRIRFGI